MTHQIGDIVNTPKGTAKIIEVDGMSLLVRIPPLGYPGKMTYICAKEVILNNQVEQGDKSPSVQRQSAG